MTRAEDLPHHKLPVIEGDISEFMSGNVLQWGIPLKGIGVVYVPQKDVRNYDKFCGACVEQLSVVFDPMPQHEWTTLLRAAVYETRRRNNRHLPIDANRRRAEARDADL